MSASDAHVALDAQIESIRANQDDVIQTIVQMSSALFGMLPADAVATIDTSSAVPHEFMASLKHVAAAFPAHLQRWVDDVLPLCSTETLSSDEDTDLATLLFKCSPMGSAFGQVQPHRAARAVILAVKRLFSAPTSPSDIASWMRAIYEQLEVPPAWPGAPVQQFTQDDVWSTARMRRLGFRNLALMLALLIHTDVVVPARAIWPVDGLEALLRQVAFAVAQLDVIEWCSSALLAPVDTLGIASAFADRLPPVISFVSHSSHGSVLSLFTPSGVCEVVFAFACIHEVKTACACVCERSWPLWFTHYFYNYL